MRSQLQSIPATFGALFQRLLSLSKWDVARFVSAVGPSATNLLLVVWGAAVFTAIGRWEMAVQISRLPSVSHQAADVLNMELAIVFAGRPALAAFLTLLVLAAAYELRIWALSCAIKRAGGAL